MKLNLLRDLSTRSFLFLLLCFAGIGNVWGEEVTITFDASRQGYSNGQEITNATITEGITIAFSNSTYYDKGAAIRVYAGNYFTIKSNVGNITQIMFTFGSDDGTNEITKDCGTYYKNSGIWEGSSKSIKFTIGDNSGHRKFKKITVTYAKVDLNSIEITGTPVNTTYYIGETPSAEGLVVTAKYSDKSTENVTDKTQWTFTPATIEQDTKSITALASYGGKIANTTYGIALSSIANTENEPYNISQACSLINNGKGLCEEVYVKGIISNIGDFQNGNITYYISDGGTESTQQFVCYMGKNTNTANFTSTDNLKIGSSVIVKGLLDKTGETYGFRENNTLIKQNTLTSISISGTATQTKYIEGDEPNADGLTVNATYSDGSNKDVTGYAVWIFNPEIIYKENESITATADYLGMTASYSIPISVDNIVYNLTPFEGGTSAYDDAGTSGILINGVNWFVYGNTGTQPWKIGGKSIKKQDRHIKTSTPIYGTIEKIVVNVGETNGDITLHSIKLSVANNASFTNSTNYDITDNLKPNQDYIFLIPPAENAYYRITYNLTVSGDTNKYYEFKGAQFFGTSASYTLNVSDAGFATLCLPYNAVVPEGVVAYWASENGEYIKLTAIPNNTIAANEGVVLKAHYGKYPITSTYKLATKNTDNLMIGVTKDTPLRVDDKAYMLTRKKEDGSVAFRLLNTDYTLGANKAYLKLPGGTKARDIISVQWDENETGIMETMHRENDKDAAIYNLSGQRMKQTQKGINIINGKLVIR